MQNPFLFVLVVNWSNKYFHMLGSSSSS